MSTRKVTVHDREELLDARCQMQAVWLEKLRNDKDALCRERNAYRRLATTVLRYADLREIEAVDYDVLYNDPLVISAYRYIQRRERANQAKRERRVAS